MERQRISGIYADAAAFAGRELTVCGWVRTVRDMKNFGFVELNERMKQGRQQPQEPAGRA